MNEQIPIITADDLIEDESLSSGNLIKKSKRDVNYYKNLMFKQKKTYE